MKIEREREAERERERQRERERVLAQATCPVRLPCRVKLFSVDLEILIYRLEKI